MMKVWLLNRTPRIRLSRDSDIDTSKYLYLRTALWLGVRNGGAVTHTEGVINALTRKNYKVSLVSPKGDHVAVGIDNFKSINVPFSGAYIIPRELNFLRYGRQIIKALASFSYDFNGIVYQRISSADVCGVEFARKRGVPLVIEFNGSELWLSENWGARLNFKSLVENAELVTLRHAHAVVAVSDALRSQLIDMGVEPDRIICVPNGFEPSMFQGTSIDAESLSETRHSIDPDGDATIVTFVGTFGPWHGAEILAHACNEILNNQKRMGKKFKFVFIGDGGGLELVRETVSECNSDNSFVFTGLISHQKVISYLMVSDMLINPTKENPDKSEFFGSPTKLFEYMAAGRLVITSNLGQNSEIVNNGVSVERLDEASKDFNTAACGIWVPPNDPESLAKAILFASENKAWCERIGANAKSYAEANYTWDAQVEKISHHIDLIIENDVRRIKILINALHAKSGGGITYLRNLLPLLARDDRLELHICLGPEQVWLFDEVIDGITLHVFKRVNSRLGVLITEQVEVPILARKISADVVFSPANFGPVAFRSTVILLRNALSVAFVERRIRKRFYWFMLSISTYVSAFFSSRIISVSSYALDANLAEGMHKSREKVSIIPHGVSDVFEPSDTFPRDDNMLLFVSDIYVQKNLHNLIEAMPKIIKHYPNMKLHIAGASIDHEYAIRLIKLADSLGVADQIIYEGSVETKRLLHLYQKCTVFVFPSTVETFGNSLVEAMACGAAVACSNAAAMPEVAKDAVEYYDPMNSADISEVICKLLSDTVRREDLSARAIKQAENYSWGRTAKLTADILVQAIKN